MRRTFSRSEKAALYRVAGGQCELCGDTLTDGWHADHKHPFSRGGATDIANAQALCPTCNLKKGSKTSMTNKLRDWQSRALDAYLSHRSDNFFAVATPGSGKTTWALTVARTLIDQDVIGRVVVVVPSDSLRTQWSDHLGTGIHLRPLVAGEPVDQAGYHGVVTTYQALGHQLGLDLRAAIGMNDTRGTLVILDEIHHAAETSAYGDALMLAFENASRRLLLTGTPWRTDPRERIPFVDPDPDTPMYKVHFTYDYGQAVRERVCRRIEFRVNDASVSWVRDSARTDTNLTVNRTLRGVDKSDAMRAVLDASPTGEWMADVLRDAHAHLRSLRMEHPDAAGLVVARDKHHAHKVQKLMRESLGVNAPVVVSAEDESGNNRAARTEIERFRRSREPWIIAVKMIAEGVDIPRLMVGVYATNVTTSMFFNQVVGRFVRVRPGEGDARACMFVPPSQALWAHVQEIQRMLPQVLEDADEKNERERNGVTARTGTADFTALGSESLGLTMVHTDQSDISGHEVVAWTEVFKSAGVPQHYAANMAASGAVAPSSPVAVEEVPRNRREKQLRSEIDSLAGRAAYRCLGDHTKKQDVWRSVWRAYGEGVKTMSIDRLESVKGWLSLSIERGEL